MPSFYSREGDPLMDESDPEEKTFPPAEDSGDISSSERQAKVSTDSGAAPLSWNTIVPKWCCRHRAWHRQSSE